MKFDKYLLYFIGMPQSGWINVGVNRLSKFDFLYKLTTAKAALMDITLIPGETTQYFLQDLSKKLNLNYEILLDEYYKLAPIPDGYLIPDTYKIPVGISERHLIYYIVNISKKKHEALSRKIFGDWNEKQWFRYLIVASIVQKEAANNEEMGLIASVIYNRLKRGMKLQMDGTLNYGLYSHEKVTPNRIKTDLSAYNTYIHNNLPPAPVCTVSTNAVLAAIFPKKSSYLYFVRNKRTGKHVFTNSYEEHISAIRQK